MIKTLNKKRKIKSALNIHIKCEIILNDKKIQKGILNPSREEKNMNKKTKGIVTTGLFIALVCISTMSIQIPMPSAGGYVNVGDAVIIIAAILFGKTTGMIAGGIGSALADVLSGYSQWAIFTLVIKGLEGYIIGLIVNKSSKVKNQVIASILGIIVMVIGYYIANGILVGSFVAAVSSIPLNIMQGVVSILLGILLVKPLSIIKK